MSTKTSKAAIVTGASSGIGREISRVLCQRGYEVYGIGRNFTEASDEEADGRDVDFMESEKTKTAELPDNFYPLVCDLLDTDGLLKIVKEICAEHEVSVLVNNAGVGYYGLHEELNVKKIQTLVRTNLEVPMILANLLLRDLKKNSGYLINISSITADQKNPHGCAYGATKAGLSCFADSLFEESRKYGVKVVTIKPDMCRTELYRNADFREGVEEESFLKPEEIAAAVEYVLDQRDGMVVTELKLRPQIHRIRRK